MRQALNAQHDWYLAGQLVATINPPPSGGYPRLAINTSRGIGGWHSTADADEAEVDSPAGRMGEFPYPRTSRGKTLTYNLQYKTDKADGLEGLNDGLNDFLAAFADRSSVGFLIVTPWAMLGLDPPALGIWGTFARVLDFDADEVQSYGPGRIPSPWIRDPILTIRQLDGRWLYYNESGDWPDDPATPMVWENLAGESVSVTNSGNAETPPTVTVYGVDAGDDVHIGRDIGGGLFYDLWLRDPVGAAGGTTDSVVVDFPNRRVFVNDIDVTKTYDAASSSWWDEFVPGVPPGTHTIWRGPGAGTGIRVHFYSASW